jgi:hypothetical protein
MKTYLVILMISLSQVVISAQSAILPSPSTGSGVKSSLAMSIGKGDVAAISESMADKVELSIAGEKETLARTDAAERLEEFYAAHPARGFIPMVKNTERTEEIGELSTENGDFKVFLQFTKRGSKRLISVMEIGVADSNVRL